MGNLASLHAASLLLREVYPQYILLVGICGGFKATRDGFKHGDIVVSDRVFYYEPQKESSHGTENRGRDLFRSADGSGQYRQTSLCALAEMTNKKTPFLQVDTNLIKCECPGEDVAHYKPTTHVGIVCSGEKVIADESFVDELLSLSPKAISVEMEAAGIATACIGTDTSFLVVKAVSDFADKQKKDGYRMFAAQAAAAFTLTLITYPFHGAGPRLSGTNEGVVLPNRPPPPAFLGDFFGAARDKGVAIVMPSYENLRHKQKKHGFINYPLNKWETAFDDVYCTFRILPSLIHLCPSRRPRLLFDGAIESEDLPSNENLVLIGSSVANVFTRNKLDQHRAFFRFGHSSKDHDIVDSSGKPCYAAKPELINRGGEKLKQYLNDYAMISVFHEPNRSICILAGCRAFSQMLLGDFLTEGSFLESLYRHIYGCDYQCIIRVKITGRVYDYQDIPAFKKRPNADSPWVDVNLPPELTNSIHRSWASTGQSLVHLK
jgi:nucleoside phosphorylase